MKLCESRSGEKKVEKITPGTRLVSSLGQSWQFIRITEYWMFYRGRSVTLEEILAKNYWALILWGLVEKNHDLKRLRLKGFHSTVLNLITNEQKMTIGTITRLNYFLLLENTYYTKHFIDTNILIITNSLITAIIIVFIAFWSDSFLNKSNLIDHFFNVSNQSIAFSVPFAFFLDSLKRKRKSIKMFSVFFFSEWMLRFAFQVPSIWCRNFCQQNKFWVLHHHFDNRNKFCIQNELAYHHSHLNMVCISHWPECRISIWFYCFD